MIEIAKWKKMSLAQQLGNIGSEVARACSAAEQGNQERRNLSLARALELAQLTLANESNQWRRSELQNLYEALLSIYNDEAPNITLSNIQDYCLPFALLTRKLYELDSSFQKTK